MTRKEELYNSIESLRSEYTTSIDNLIHTILTDWQVLSLNDDSMRIGFNTGEFWEGTDIHKKQDLDIYFGNFWYGDKEPRFQINTCCFGSFDLEGDSTPATYYKGVGTILSNDSFKADLRKLLFEFHDKMKVFKSEIYDIKAKEDIEARKIREEEEKKAKEIENADNLKKLSENPNADVVIKLYKDKTHTSIFSYRNRPADIISFHDPSTYNAYAEARRMNKNLASYANYSYKDVDASKIKVAA